MSRNHLAPYDYVLTDLLVGIAVARIFVSYSSKDRDIVQALAAALERTKINGIMPQVWWDRGDDGLQAGDDYWRKIAEALDVADATIVLWSDNSLVSDWVYSEACRAKGRRKIVPVSIAGRLTASPPMPFDVLHTPAISDILAAMPELARAIEARIAGRPLVIAKGRNASDLDQDVLELKRDPMPADVLFGPGDFLKARNQTGFIEFIDANDPLTDFLNWARRPAGQAQGRSALARLVHAAGGFGKTRLMIELARRLEQEGWLVGFVPRGLVGGTREAVLQRLVDTGRDAAGLLLVVDYVEQRQLDAAWIAQRLAARSTEPGRRPARLVLLARGAGEWWQSWLDETPPLQRLATLAPPLPGRPATYDVVRLPASFPGAERIDLFNSSFAAFRHHIADVVPHVPPASDSLVALIESDARYARPLAIQMAALLYAYGYDPAAGGTDIADLLGKILGLERDHWTRALNLADEGEHKKEKRASAISRATAQSTLCLGVPGRDSFISLLGRDPKIALMNDIDVLDVYAFLSRLYPGENSGIAALEPDLLGEHHVTTVCDDAIVDACLAIAVENQEMRRSILTVLNRASRSEHGPAGQQAHLQLARLVRQYASQLADDLVLVAITTPGRLLEEIEKYPTLRSVALREQALLLERSKDVSGGVSALTILPDGRLASGAWDNSIRLWHLNSGTERARLAGHAGGVSSLVALPDGRLASGSLGNTLRIWNLDNCAQAAHIVDRTSGVTSLAVLADGRLASGLVDTTVRLYDLASGANICLRGHTGPVRALAALPKCLLASGSDDGTVRLWDIRDGAEVGCLKGHKGSVTALAWLPDDFIVSASEDQTARIWHVKSGAEIGILEGHTGTINALAVLPGGRLATGSQDNTIRLWDQNRHIETARLESRAGPINALAVLPDGRLASGAWDNTIPLWDINSCIETIRLDSWSRQAKNSEALPDDLSLLSRQAVTLTKSAARFSQLGQRERALAESERAVAIHRSLVGRNRDVSPVRTCRTD